jgi:DNA gyrase subunit A
MATLENGIEQSIQEQPLDRYMEESYRRYAVLTILDRALPDIRDGLKPVQRRILYAMGDMNLNANTPHRKSARVVGEVLGKYHPHGDQSVYDAMVRMAQDFSMRKPLIDGQGNYGSIDGDSAAAMRYTEARLAALGEGMLEDLEKDTVDWRPNFDGSLREPTVLPARFPNLLVNGASGIAVGMSTNILPHNLGEVCDAVVFLTKSWAKRDTIKISDLIKFIPGPDLPTGGLLYRYRVSTDGSKVDMIQRAYEMGAAPMVCQAKADIQDIGGGKAEIIVTELPYQVQKTTILERIAASRERFNGITDVRDESDYKGMRIVFEVGRGQNPEEVLNRLLSYTAMRVSLPYNALALVVDNDGKASPHNLTLLDMLREFILHRLKVITRRSKFELDRAEARLHVLEGLLKALAKIDQVIDTIRKSENTETARANLMKRFKLSEIQAQAILDMPLRRLAALERQKLEEESRELAARVKTLREILGSEDRRLAVVAEETLDIKARYADPRRTVIVDAEEGHQARVTVADLVVPTEPQLILVTQNGVQRVNLKGYRDATATRGKLSGRAVEFPVARVEVAPDESVALISNKGRLWKGNAGRVALQSSFTDLGLGKDERVISAGVLRPGGKLVLVTRSGNIKRTNVEDLSARGEGSWAAVIGLEGANDEVILAGVASEAAHVLLATSGTEKTPARALRFESKSVNPQVSPTAKGVAAIKMMDDAIIGGALLEPDAAAGKNGAKSPGFALLLTERGLVKRVALDEFPVQGRGGQGVQTWKISKATGQVVGLAAVSAAGDADIYTERGKRLRMAVKDIPVSTRAGKPADLAAIVKIKDLFTGEAAAGVASAG